MGIFNSYTKPGKGLSKEDLDKTGLALYFDIFFRRFWKLISINFMYLVASIPAIIIAFGIAFYFVSACIGASGILESGLDKIDITKIHFILVIPVTVIAFQLTGSGPASVAKDYMLRKYVKDTHVWLWSDFVKAFKKNFWQGMAVYILNTIILVLILFAYLFYRYIMMSDALSIVMLVLLVIFVVMQKYIYVLVSGFKLKVKDIYRNAGLLSILGIKWNILSLAITASLMIGMWYLYLNMMAIALVIILAFYFAVISFTQIFITRSVISKFIEEPALAQESQNQKNEQ